MINITNTSLTTDNRHEYYITQSYPCKNTNPSTSFFNIVKGNNSDVIGALGSQATLAKQNWCLQNIFKTIYNGDLELLELFERQFWFSNDAYFSENARLWLQHSSCRFVLDLQVVTMAFCILSKDWEWLVNKGLSLRWFGNFSWCRLWSFENSWHWCYQFMWYLHYASWTDFKLSSLQDVCHSPHI